jgi:hypothetical protein
MTRHELAWHEAGHAVVAALLGQPIEWVIIDEANGSGETELKTGPFVRLEEPFESRRRFLIAMAGSVAQCLAAASCECRWMPGSDGDEERAKECADLAGLMPNDFSIVLAILSRSNVWAKVVQLAAALLTHHQFFAWTGLAEFLPEGDRDVWEMAGISSRPDFLPLP